MSAKHPPDGKWEPYQWSSWIQDKLRLREWTAADFARALKKRNGTVSRWINGTRRPSPESCEDIADVLHEPTKLVMSHAGYPVQDLKVDSRTEGIISIVERIAWNDEREQYARALLESMPRKKERS